MKNLLTLKIKKGGFTLIELLVVVAIISLLTSIVLAALVEAREKAQKSKFRKEVDSLIQAIELYKADKEYYPLEKALSRNASAYLRANGQEGNYAGENFSTLFVPKYLSKIPTLIDPTVSLDQLLIYRLNNFDAPVSVSNYFYRCVGDTSIPPYVIIVQKRNSDINKNFDALDWRVGYEFSLDSLNWQNSSGTFVFKCFSIQ